MDIKNIINTKTITAGALAVGVGALAYTGKLAPINAKVQALATAAMPHINALIAEAGSLANAAITHLTPYTSAASAAAAEYIAMTGLTPLTLSVGLGVGATALVIILVLIRKNRALSKQLEESKQLKEEWKQLATDNLNQLMTAEVNLQSQLSEKNEQIAKKDKQIVEMQPASEDNKRLRGMNAAYERQILNLQNEKSKLTNADNEQKQKLRKQSEMIDNLVVLLEDQTNNVERIKELNASVRESGQKIESLKGALKESDQRVESLEISERNLRAEKETLERQLKAGSEEIDELKSANETLLRENRGLRDKNQNLEKRVKALSDLFPETTGKERMSNRFALLGSE